MTKNHKAKMAPMEDEPPGMERDSKGKPIPLAQRLPEDRAKARRARRKNSEDPPSV